VIFRYSKEHLDFLAREYAIKCLPQLTEAFNQQFGLNKSKDQIRAALKNHKITCGRTGCFEKGMKPWNAGTKGLVQPNSGNFKKGQIPKNHKPIGHERVCSKDGYILIKVDEVNPYTGAQGWYRFKHVVIWEQMNGPVPKGHVVRFKDGNKLNCAPENLVLLTRREHMQITRSGFSDVPKHLKPSVLEIGRLESKLFELKNRKAEQ